MHLDAITKQVGVMTTMEVPQQFRMEGWVYVLSNPCMPGIYKVGMTTTSPEIRARELSSATGVPAPFKIEAAFYTHSPLESEKEVHEVLSEWRVNDSREFFELSLGEIIHACSQSCEAQVGESVESIAVYNDFITFETLGKLNVNSLFDDIGISVFGDKLAAAERLIRIGADTVLNIRKNTASSLPCMTRMRTPLSQLMNRNSGSTEKNMSLFGLSVSPRAFTARHNLWSFKWPDPEISNQAFSLMMSLQNAIRWGDFCLLVFGR